MPRNNIFQYKTLNSSSQDKKRGFGFCPAIAESPCTGFEVQGPHQQPNASIVIFQLLAACERNVFRSLL